MTLLGKRRVLVAEDEYLVALIASDILEEAGAVVTLAADGSEALAHVELNGPFDLLVTDIRMPGMDGWTLAERARMAQPDLLVVYVTGFSDIDPRQVEGSAFLRKPYRDVDLIAAAAMALTPKSA
jgi:CheY-like chemotaxis protein